jgi:hypothetical protein
LKEGDKNTGTGLCFARSVKYRMSLINSWIKRSFRVRLVYSRESYMLVGDTTMKNNSFYSKTGQLGPRPPSFEVFR